MATLSGTALIFTMLALLALGALIGYAFAWKLAQRDSGGRKPAEVKREFDDYRAKVDDHFATTNEMLQRLTAQYREVYAHMASGAQELCDAEPARLEEHLRLEEMPAAQEAEPATFEDEQPTLAEDAADGITAEAEADAQGEAPVEDVTQQQLPGDTDTPASDDDPPAARREGEEDVAGGRTDASGDQPPGGTPTIVAVDDQDGGETQDGEPDRRSQVGAAA